MKSWLNFSHQGDSGGPLVQKAGGKAAGDKWTQVGISISIISGPRSVEKKVSSKIMIWNCE